MKNLTWKSVPIVLAYAAMYFLAAGALSYLSASGRAVMGPDPASLNAQRTAIISSTLWWEGAVGTLAILAFVVRTHRPKT